MGASLAAGCVRQGRLVCPWHGLELGDKPQGAWRPLPVHDDGVLVWVRLDDAGEAPTERPMLPVRPARYIDAVVRLEARCRPEDLLANRLDPWHGVHYHGHTFRRLRVVERKADEITVRVAFAVIGRLAVEVDARFHCPDPRTIVMTIVRGDGEGSVVETHATPIDETRCAVVEATLATSDRPQMKHVLPLCPLGAALAREARSRLSVEDVAYAERRRSCWTRRRERSPCPHEIDRTRCHRRNGRAQRRRAWPTRRSAEADHVRSGAADVQGQFLHRFVRVLQAHEPVVPHLVR